MLKYYSLIVLSLAFVARPSMAQEMSAQQIFELARGMNLRSLEELPEKNRDLYKLGEALFFDKELSGNRNISCGSCHSPKFYSADGLALGIGEGSQFTPVPELLRGKILKRHTPHLINLGRDNIRHYFWDGRISRSSQSQALFTPEPKLNGQAPELSEIVRALSGPFAAQALFPMLSPEEMRGQPGSNELSDIEDNARVWSLIIQRLAEGEKKEKYNKLFSKAFPQLDVLKLNIGHIGSALAEFQKYFFSSYDTPYDRFLEGDLEAMDERSIKGLQVFMTKGRCVTCHGGEQLTLQQFESSGAP
ncbi:MAG: hypothetical protein HRT44_04435, partial [Bdellovibrionales bacterium]|nr:hypothetical protein [Bdellovibrionales bacterium]NQZ18491.1 hypothetical protein [Bdellovibrionales bacterium]